MRSILGMLVVCVTACASHPADNAPRRVKVDASNIVAVQKAGYIIKNKDGKKLYCTGEMETGSHIQTTTICLTEQEWDQLHDNTQRAMHAISKQIPPAQGH